MTQRTLLWALVALNALLLVGLSWKIGGENTAQAQRLVPDDCLLIPGRLVSSPNGVIYLIDTRNGILGAYAFDSNRRELIPMQPIDLNATFAAGPGIGPSRRP